MTSDALVIPMQQSAFDCLLRWALIAGALFDLVFGIAILACWRKVLELLCIPPPDNPSYLFLAAVFRFRLFLLLFAGRILGHPFLNRVGRPIDGKKREHRAGAVHDERVWV